jgi:hypothetical protein
VRPGGGAAGVVVVRPSERVGVGQGLAEVLEHGEVGRVRGRRRRRGEEEEGEEEDGEDGSGVGGVHVDGGGGVARDGGSIEERAAGPGGRRRLVGRVPALLGSALFRWGFSGWGPGRAGCVCVIRKEQWRLGWEWDGCAGWAVCLPFSLWLGILSLSLLSSHVWSSGEEEEEKKMICEYWVNVPDLVLVNEKRKKKGKRVCLLLGAL